MTSIIHRYLMVSFLRNLGYTLAGALVLFILVDLFDHIGSLLDNRASPGMIGRYYFYKVPWILDNILPVAMLMATLFTVGGMARYLELTALFSSGWSLMHVCRPLILFAALATLLALGLREYILPTANTRWNRVWEVEIHQQPDRITPTERITLTDGQGRMYYARKFDPASGVLTQLRIVVKDGSRVIERIDAARAEWDGNHWILIGGSRRVFADGEEVITRFDRLTARDLTVGPKNFYRDQIRQEDMNIRQLREHALLVAESGGDSTSARVDIQYNLAFPLVNLIVVLMGLVLASGPRKTTVASGFGVTLLISFGYFIVINLTRSLGHTGSVPPLAAGWSANVIFLAIFLVLFARARR